MQHYVYKLVFENGMKYIGARTTKGYVLAKDDILYLGSGRNLPKDRDITNVTKTILCIYSTRQEAIEAEIAYIDKYDCVNSPDYYNVKRKTFDRYGTKSRSPYSAEILAIRKKAAVKAGKLRSKKYTGSGRTPAQIRGSKIQAEKIRGVPNPAKAHKGITSSTFSPWYYITPEGDKTVVTDITIKDYSKLNILPFTLRQIKYRFHYSNIDKEGKCKPFKGWIFGHCSVTDNM